MSDEESNVPAEVLPALDPALILSFQQYKQDNQSWSPKIDLWNYIGANANFDLAAAFTKLFWPDFIEVDGCVLLGHAYSPDNFAAWMEHYKGERSAVESLLNHVHVWDLFGGTASNYPEPLSDYLAKAMLFGWKQALASTFPGRRFVFSCKNGYGPEISFHQVRDTAQR